ncbi:cyclic AMP-dependent transcription factor ATF-6 beta [Lethenteron reissneri]|uniref:cyclic AMP-dependent transcription factor ATF-6 beta n=1 Tax=Lethenteron reissneri TaxID=7753 RepID=UPI002AB608F3|nr:cyclic AMP-dependent transcription factor ATF-6 beta [Lethenteron reissneri]
MATEYISELDSRFFADNLLMKEDWDGCLYDLENMDIPDDPEDPFGILRDHSHMDEDNDIELKLESLSPSSSSSSSSDPWSHVYTEIFQDVLIKEEPPSPPSSNSSEVLISTVVESSQKHAASAAPCLGVKLEGPPTPPYCVGDIPSPPRTQASGSPPSQTQAILEWPKREPKHEALAPTTGLVPTQCQQKAPQLLQSNLALPSGITAAPNTTKTLILQPVTSLVPQTIAFQAKPAAQPVVLSTGGLTRLPAQCLLKQPQPGLGRTQLAHGPCNLPQGGLANGLSNGTANGVVVKGMANGLTTKMENGVTGTSVAGLCSPTFVGSMSASAPGACLSPPASTAPPTTAAAAAAVVKRIVPLQPPSRDPYGRDVDVKVLKRQQRMIKNRESACQSRRKKKEYVTGLEARLRDALGENERLRRDNAELKQRLEGLITENTQLKGGGVSGRRAVCVMALFCFLALTWSPGRFMDSDTVPMAAVQSPAELTLRHGRHLLAVPPEPPAFHTQPHPHSPRKHHVYTNKTTSLANGKELLVTVNSSLPSLRPPSCPHFNKTESLRLADELRGWVYRHEVERRKVTKRWQPKPPSPPKFTTKRSSIGRILSIPHPDATRAMPSNQLQLYGGPAQGYIDFLEAIDRQDDTFYVVSFSRDHLLLPAMSHNKTRRPKMSLVMPAMALNDSLVDAGPAGYETMMQVDCEVTNTRIVRIRSSSVPPSLRRASHDNATGSYSTNKDTSPQDPTHRDDPPLRTRAALSRRRLERAASQNASDAYRNAQVPVTIDGEGDF